MASSSVPRIYSTLFVALSLFSIGAFGEIICEQLAQEICAYAISSNGNRCLLENNKRKDGSMEYQCKTSEVVVERMSEWIETEECVKACGVDRKSVGISSDMLMDPSFTANLCSASCLHNCHNIADLYFNLAAGEGVFLPHLCEAQRSNPHRAMAELLSSGFAAGPGGEAMGPVPSNPSASSPTSI